MAKSEAFQREKEHSSTTGPAPSSGSGAVSRVMGALSTGGQIHRVDRDREDAYWCEKCENEGYFRQGLGYKDYAPAFRVGYEGFGRYGAAGFEGAEPTLREEYVKGGGTLPWEEARTAAHAAWTRVERGESFSIPLSEEELTISKHEVEAGRVRLHKEVETETVDLPVELRREEAVVERVEPTSQKIPDDAFQEKTIEIPLKCEEAVVEKRSHIIGEVEVRKSALTETENIQGEVRREEVVLEKEGNPEVRERGDQRK